jgi:hypothetical protein
MVEAVEDSMEAVVASMAAVKVDSPRNYTGGAQCALRLFVSGRLFFAESRSYLMYTE